MLKIWLPLTKDERNLGLASGLSVNTNVTFTDGGNIGNAGTFNGSSSYIMLPQSVPTTTKTFTYSVFAKFNNVSATQCLYSQRTSVGIGFAIFLIGGKIRFDSGRNDDAAQWTTAQSMTANTWTHIALTTNGLVKKIYVNGVFMQSASTTTTANLGTGVKATIGGSVSSDNGVATGNWVNGQLNDVRIYDHELKDWEIKDLYNCKVLGVNGGMFLEETTNLITGITKGGQTNIVNNEVLTTGTNADTYFTLNLSESIVVGTQYTISCYADLPSGTYWNFPLGTQSNTALTWSIVPGYNSYTFTANDISWGANKIFMDDLSGPARTSGQQCRFYRFQLEKKSHATPLSFGHRDNRIVDLTDYNQNDITPYSLVKSGSSIYFNGVDSAIKIPMHEMISGGTWSINLWFYRPNGEFGTKSWETLVGGPSGFELEATSSSTKTLYVCPYSWGGGKFAYEADRWNMVTLTRTSSGSKLYINGSLVKSGSAGSMPSGDYFIGAWKTATQQNFKGYMRRFSIYKKELTQEDITNLYQHSE